MYNRYVRNDNGTYTRIPEESQVPPPSGHEVHAHHEYDPSHPPDDSSPGTAEPGRHQRRPSGDPPPPPSSPGGPFSDGLSSFLRHILDQLHLDHVDKQIEKIHEEYVSAIQYNNENSLSSVLAVAYLSAMQYYFKPVRELPTGRGFADFVFIPKPEYKNDYPALIVELKWNKSAKSALQQIKDKKYPNAIKNYTGAILLVGINYNKENKKHECMIEKMHI